MPSPNPRAGAKRVNLVEGIIVNLSIERVKDALSRSFDEGMSGYAEMKDELLDSLLAELVATSESNNQINIQI